MTPEEPIAADLGREMFDAARHHPTLQGLSIVKFLGARDDEEARETWLTMIAAFVEVLPVGVFRRAAVVDSAPVLEFADDVVTRINVGQLVNERELGDAWRVGLLPPLAPVLSDAVGWSRWGSVWEETLRARTASLEVPEVKPVTPPILDRWTSAILREDGVGDSTRRGDHGWLIEFSRLGFHLWFRDPARARRAALALAFGNEAIGSLFLEMETPRRGDTS